MPRITTCILTLLLATSALFSANTLAYKLPKGVAAADVPSRTHKALYISNKSKTKLKKNLRTKNVKAALLTQYFRWKGTQYRLGGTTRKGVDCSALMQHLFHQSLNKRLPRTTAMQMKHGRKVSKQNLKPGDLVFFKTNPAERHVGVYVGKNQFIHASRIEGVTISSLDNPYWVNHYETARRLALPS